jgi:hypothetical protein
LRLCFAAITIIFILTLCDTRWYCEWFW